MTDEKKNVIIGAGLSVAAVVVLWLFLRHNPKVVAPAPSNVDPTATVDPGAGYTNYNLAPYPPAVGDPYGPKQKSNSCCDTCDNALSNGGVNNSISAFLALMDKTNV